MLCLALGWAMAGCGGSSSQEEAAGGCIDSFDCAPGFFCNADLLNPNSRGDCVPMEAPEDQCATTDDCRRGMVCLRGACVEEQVEEREDPVPGPQDDLEQLPDEDPSEPDDGTCAQSADCEVFEECCEGACVARGQCEGTQPDPEPDPEPNPDGTCAGQADCEVFQECCEGACVDRGQCPSNQPPEPDPNPTPGDASQCPEACSRLSLCTTFLGCLLPLVNESDCISQCQQDPNLASIWLGATCDAINLDACEVPGVRDLCLFCPTPPNIGEPCSSNLDCEVSGFLRPVCLRAVDRQTGEPTGWDGGYCVGADCFGDDECGAESSCVRAGDSTYCLKSCNASGECRAGYTCRPLDTVGVCVPRCEGDADCGDGLTCDQQTGLCQ